VTLERVRHGLLLTAAVGTAGIALELASLRHWTSPLRMVAWLVLVPLVLGITIALRPTTPGRRRAIAVLLGAATLLAVYGVYVHTRANVDAGSLDYRFSKTWDSKSVVSRWWTAASGGVGPAPVFAPAIYAYSAAVTWLSVALAPKPEAEAVPS
jgi:hypothetical protein